MSKADVAQELFDLFHAVRRVTLEKFNEEGLSFARAKVLWTLEKDGPMRVSALAEHLDCATASASELVDALTKDGLAARTPDPDDRRAALIDLTDKGRESAKATRALKRRVLNRVFDTLTPEETAQLKELLGRLATSPTLQGVPA